MELDRRLAVRRVHRDLVADVVQGEVPWTAEGDFAELAPAAAAPHDLVHPVHRRPEDLRDLIDRRRGRVREAHHGRRVASGDALEDFGDEMVHLSVDDVVDAELLLHPFAAIEVPSARPSEDDLVFPIRPLQPADEVEEHRLRIRGQDAPHREGHADRTESQRVHRVEADDLGVVADVLFDLPRVRDDDGIPALRLDEGCLDLPQAVRHADGTALLVDLRGVRQDPEDETRLPLIRGNAAEERGQRDVSIVRHKGKVRCEHVLRDRSPSPARAIGVWAAC